MYCIHSIFRKKAPLKDIDNVKFIEICLYAHSFILSIDPLYYNHKYNHFAQMWTETALYSHQYCTGDVKTIHNEHKYMYIYNIHDENCKSHALKGSTPQFFHFIQSDKIV